MTEQIDTPKLHTLLKLNGLEELLNSIDIEHVKDHNIKVILRTIKHSIQTLHEEITSDIAKY
jgi:hypothetical protein